MNNLNSKTQVPVLIILTMLFVLACFSLNRSVWGDEAALLVNIKEIKFVDILTPLPYYTQASPVFPLFIQKLIYQLTGDNFFIFRLCSFTLFILALFYFLTSLLKKVNPVAWLLVSLLGTYSILYSSTEIKHYSFEFIASLFIILAFFEYLNFNIKRAFLLSCIGVVLGFSNIIAFGLMIAFVLFINIREKQYLFEFFKCAVLSILLIVATYFLMKHLTAYQISSHSEYLSRGFFADIKVVFKCMISSHSKILILLSILSCLFGFFQIHKNKIYFHFTCLYSILIVSVFILKLSGLYPIIYGKHLLWLLPFSITLITLFFQHISLKNEKLAAISLVLLAGVFFVKQSYYFVNNNEKTANDTLISKINEICIPGQSNFITDSMAANPIVYTYKNMIKKNCLIETKLLKSSEQVDISYFGQVLDSLHNFKQDSDNYFVVSHLDINNERHPYVEYLVSAFDQANFGYSVVFYDNNVSILKLNKLVTDN